MKHLSTINSMCQAGLGTFQQNIIFLLKIKTYFSLALFLSTVLCIHYGLILYFTLFLIKLLAYKDAQIVYFC